jgi:hypothetical protein
VTDRAFDMTILHLLSTVTGVRFATICAHLERVFKCSVVGPEQERRVDRALQRLRRSGKIKFEKGGWRGK